MGWAVACVLSWLSYKAAKAMPADALSMVLALN
jgi:hypothetical protein